METYKSFINSLTPFSVTCIVTLRKKISYFPEYDFNVVQLEITVNEAFSLK